MIPVVSVLVVLTISLVIVRVAAVGLTLTGVSKDLAELQALSAFTGTGFTTKESEEIVNHPVRRRIVMHLMLLGNVGIVLAISSLLLSFLNAKEYDDWYEHTWFRILVLAIGILFLSLVSRSKYLETAMWQANTWALQRWGNLSVLDYTKLLRLADDYVVYELSVSQHDWLADQSLAQSQLASEGVLVLGIERQDGRYLGAPRGSTTILAGDSLIVYGRLGALHELDSRQAGMIGNLHHVMAVTKQRDIVENQTVQDSPK